MEYTYFKQRFMLQLFMYYGIRSVASLIQKVRHDDDFQFQSLDSYRQ